MASRKALFAVVVGTGASLLTGASLYAFQLSHLTNDSQRYIQNLSRQITSREVSFNLNNNSIFKK